MPCHVLPRANELGPQKAFIGSAFWIDSLAKAGTDEFYTDGAER